jgi:hypothetical protein
MNEKFKCINVSFEMCTGGGEEVTHQALSAKPCTFYLAWLLVESNEAKVR